MAAIPVALGVRVHTGWAAVVTLAGPASGPRVVDRRRLELFAPADKDGGGAPRSAQPPAHVFHAAAELPLPAAKIFVHKTTAEVRARADDELGRLAGDLGRDHRVVALGIIAGGGRLPADLEDILGSHPFLHTAEGKLYRQAIVAAGERRGFPIVAVAARKLYSRGGEVAGVPEAALRARLAALGKPLGSPWAQDQKESALVAWIALAESKG